jgi:hypothetical protein
MPQFTLPDTQRNSSRRFDCGFYCQRARESVSVWANDQGVVSDI